MGKVTLNDVAKKLGIAKGSVSKALNNKPDISQEMKELVKKTVEEMGYMPNSFAQKLRTKKSRTIGIFILSSSDIKLSENFAVYYLDGIMEEIKRKDYDIIIFSITTDWINEKSYKKVWEEKMVDGAIFMGLGSFDPHLDEIKNANIPISLIDFQTEGKRLFCVSSDNLKGIYAATEYLWGLNHRNIAFVTGNLDSPVARERLNGYKKFMSEKGLNWEEWVVGSNFKIGGGYEAADEIYKMEERPTAIVTSSDIQALGIISRFGELGIKVPEDVSVIGFDDIISGRYSNPQLTTIAQPSREIGIAAALAIFEMMEGEKGLGSLKMETELIERKSCKRID